MQSENTDKYSNSRIAFDDWAFDSGFTSAFQMR